METTAYLALSRQTVLRRQMDVIANNIANMNTSGFQSATLALEPTLEDGGDRQTLAFVQDFGTVRDLAPGPLVPTGNPLDLALEGEGWFGFETQDGVRYGRAGHFSLNAAGDMVSAAGDPLLDQGGGRITVPLAANAITVAADGTVSADGAIIGEIGRFRFADPQALERVGGNLFRTAQPAEAATAGVVQGVVEGSNVQAVAEMTRMMTTVRAYQSTQRVIDTHHDLQRRAIERMLQPGGGQA